MMVIVRTRDFLDALEIQSALEAFAARLAAQRGINAAQGALLRHYVATMEDIALAFGTLSIELLDRYADTSRRFHELLFRLADSSVLARHVADEFVSPYPFFAAHVLTRARAKVLRNFMRFEQDQHLALVDAMLQRNGARAEALAREHARFNRSFLTHWESELRALAGAQAPSVRKPEPIAAK
jgi:GntR family transcriptional regulator, vanillate catabolism transcriptional regulator